MELAQNLPFELSTDAGWHVLFEVLAYTVGFTIFRRQRRRADFLAAPTRWSLVVGAVLGAVLGSKVLHHLANPSRWSEYLEHPWLLLGGKTIVGALLGGWLVVEIVKRRMQIRERTGDLYVLPLLTGMAIGRGGCFLAGLTDGTYGIETSLPWGVDFGDGVTRHPTQLYEILFLVALGLALYRPSLRLATVAVGLRFRAFILGYLLFRLLVDFLKPYDVVLGMNPIQWACLVTICFSFRDLGPIVWTFSGSRPGPSVPKPAATGETTPR